MKHSFTNHPSINTVNQINNLACNIFKQLMLLLFMFTETDKVPQVFSFARPSICPTCSGYKKDK